MSDDPNEPHPHRRRKRYRGTHPRRFDEKYKEHDSEQHPGIIEQVKARGGTPAGTHVPILVQEVMQALQPKAGDVVADCTLGYGGHTAEFLRRIGPTGRLIAFDLDVQQLERTTARLRSEFPGHRIEPHHANYAGIDKGLAGGSDPLIGYDIIFADLGVSSMQIDDPDRGFTYKHEGPLDMRMDPERGRPASELLQTVTHEKLAAALADLADEPDARKIADAIIKHRAQTPIARTSDLVRLIFEAKRLSPKHWREQIREHQALTSSRQNRLVDTSEQSASHDAPTAGHRVPHPAARTFQALRILVNDELGSLAQLLRIAPYCLRPGGRIGLITFHSGEDRQAEASLAANQLNQVYSLVCPEPLRPSPRERFDNPRSRSARFRWATRR